MSDVKYSVEDIKRLERIDFLIDGMEAAIRDMKNEKNKIIFSHDEREHLKGVNHE